ncbi:hypothetical protein [Crenothrix sp.]|uniref:hypothetical protein n=1 Tax=Crenothrix sp. TaxID=3100433 RepID=UPI00374D7FED
MNKVKREETRKHEEARRGLSDDQIAALNLEDALKAKVHELALSIHAKNFHEEYDLIYDSYADVLDRRKGINPMSQEYIEQIRQKRKALGVSQLSDEGLAVSEDTFIVCENEAKKQIYADVTLKRPPAKTCVFCDKSLEEVGGRRLVAQRIKGVKLSAECMGGGNPDFPYKSVKLFDDLKAYVVVWGEKSLWTESAVNKAKNEFLTGHRPWFCQICGVRACMQCGSPINHPSGSDVLCSDGNTTHASILPCDCGCINPTCKKYQSFKSESSQ